MKLYLNFNEFAKTGAGAWEDFSDALRFDGFSRKSCFGAGGKTEQQTVSMTLEPVVGLEALAVRILTAPNDIRAKLTQDDGTPYFVGTIRPLVTGSVQEKIKPISVEILDDTYHLHTYIFDRNSATANDLKVINADPGKSLIHWLISQGTIKNNLGQYVPAFAHADIIIDPALDQNVQAYGFQVTVGDYVDGLLDEICYEYNMQYRATEDGKILFVPSVPGGAISGVRTLADKDIKRSLSPKRGDDVNRGAVVTYYPVVYGSLKVAEHSIMDGRWSTTKTSSRGYEWLDPSDGDYPPAAYQDIRLASADLDNSQREILRYDYPTLKTVTDFNSGSLDKSQGLASINANGDGSYKLKIRALNNRTYVTALYATGYCWYVDKELEKTTQVHQGPDPQEYTAKHLHDGVAANKLLKAMVLRSTGGNITYTFQALPGLALYPGEIVSLAPATLGISSHVRIISVTDAGGDKRTPFVKVIAEGVTSLANIIVDTNEQVRIVLGKAGEAMLKLTPSAPAMRWEPLSGSVDVVATGDALARLGGSVRWWINGLPMIETGNTVTIGHQGMEVGDNVITARATIPGVDFGSKPLEATCRISLVRDGDQGPQGAPGAKGADGAKGAAGTPGAKGDQGPQGIQGPQGPQGVKGPDGADGGSLYTWVAYANDDKGAGIAALPAGKKYIGLAYNKTVQEATLTPGLFSWAKIEGPQGVKGPDGAVLYTWIRYADTPTTGMADLPDGKTYMGVAYNKTTSDESDLYTDYSWSLIKGDKGLKGDQGNTGAPGTPGAKGDTGNPGAKGDPGAKGNPGADAKGFTMEASALTYALSSRGVTRGALVITAKCKLMNISGAISWAVPEGVTADPATGEATIITIEDGLELQSFTITCTVAGYGSQELRINGVQDGTPAPMYLYTRDEVPEDTPEGPLVAGDFFLAGSTFSKDGTQYKVATLWEYSGSDWALCTDGSKAQIAMDDYAKIADQAEDGVFNQIVSKRIITLEANVKALMAMVLTIQEGGRIESMNYDPGKKGFQLLANGIINAIAANLIDCNIDGTGTFKGVIVSDPLTTTTESEASSPVNFSAKTHWWQGDLDASLSGYALNTVHAVTGSLDGGAVTSLLRSNGDTTLTYKNVTFSKMPFPEMAYTMQGAGTIDILLQCMMVRWRPYPTHEGMERPLPLAITINGVEQVSYASNILKAFSYAVVAGDVVECHVVPIGIIDGSSGNAIYKLTQSFTGVGTHLLRSGTWELIPAGVYSTRTLVISGLYDHSSRRRFAKGDAFVSGVQEYPVNELKAASGAFTYNDQPYQVVGVMRSSAGMNVYHLTGFIPITASPDAYSGFYDASGSYAIVASVAGAEMMNINARDADVYSIGMVKRFLQIAAKNLIGENVSGTTVTGDAVNGTTITGTNINGTTITGSTVYGAVAN